MTVVNRPSRPHRAFRGFTDDWVTPRFILQGLGKFDLDPCCPKEMPWRTAEEMWTTGGDILDWRGRVWLNPPYGPLSECFMRKMASHNNGTALVFARTETCWFHHYVWNEASAVLFLKGRLHFCDVKGEPAAGNAGGPSVLCAYGRVDADNLRYSGLEGRYIDLKEV